MKKLAKTTIFLFLLVTVCFTGLANGIYDATNPERLGLFTKGRVANFKEVVPGTNIRDYSVTKTNGGVIFHTIAVAEGNAIDQPVTIYYDPSQLDGWRLLLTIGSTTTTPELYDFEIIPIARFVESGYAAAMTMYDDRVNALEPEEQEIHERIRGNRERIFWANFNPALGDTLIGFNLFFVDAMFIEHRVVIDSDTIFNRPIRGYHTTWLNEQDVDRDSRMRIANTVKQRIQQEVYRGKVSSYIYTDDGVKISYRIENGQIVFNGVPTYMFLLNDHINKRAIIADNLNEDIVAMHDDIFAMNPTVYRSAERTAQWAAFFRMVQKDYPQEWQQFLEQIDGKVASPRVQTPRYWLPDGQR